MGAHSYRSDGPRRHLQASPPRSGLAATSRTGRPPGWAAPHLPGPGLGLFGRRRQRFNCLAPGLGLFGRRRQRFDRSWLLLDYRWWFPFGDGGRRQAHRPDRPCAIVGAAAGGDHADGEQCREQRREPGRDEAPSPGPDRIHRHWSVLFVLLVLRVLLAERLAGTPLDWPRVGHACAVSGSTVSKPTVPGRASGRPSPPGVTHWSPLTAETPWIPTGRTPGHMATPSRH